MRARYRQRYSYSAKVHPKVNHVRTLQCCHSNIICILSDTWIIVLVDADADVDSKDVNRKRIILNLILHKQNMLKDFVDVYPLQISVLYYNHKTRHNIKQALKKSTTMELI